jgi:hypothetical protein
VKINEQTQTLDGILLLISNALLGNYQSIDKSFLKYNSIFSISAIVSKDFCTLPQFLQTNTEITLQIRTPTIPFKTVIHSSSYHSILHTHIVPAADNDN